MTTRALVLAAHGSRHEPAVNAAIRTYADAIGVRGLFDEVAVAFHQGEPPFSAVLDQLRSDEVVVVPVMTSEGYYSDCVLPRELAKNRRFAVSAHPMVQGTGPDCPSGAKDCSHGWSAAEPVEESVSPPLRPGRGGGTRNTSNSGRNTGVSFAPLGRHSEAASKPRVPRGGPRPPNAPPVATICGPFGAEDAKHLLGASALTAFPAQATTDTLHNPPALPSLRISKPVGTHPAIADLMHLRLRSLLTRFECLPRQTSVVVVGHGTPRHSRSRNATVELAEKLAKKTTCAEVLPAFLDEEPIVDSIIQRASCENVIVLLFLIGSGPHAIRDIPRRIGMSLPETAELPVACSVAGRSVVCDRPIGSDAGILDIIIELSGLPRCASSNRDAKGGSRVLHLEGVS